MTKILAMILSYRERMFEIKSENPHIKHGLVIIKLGVSILVGGFILTISLNIPKIQFYFKMDTGIGWFIICIGTILTLGGIISVFIGLSATKQEWSTKKFYYLKGLENQTKDPPFYALPKMALWYHQTPILLTIRNQNLDYMFEDLQYSIKTIEGKIEQYQSQDVFFAGMARIPCLFFIGYAFRNGHSLITLIDHNHQNDAWFRLDQVDDLGADIIIEPHVVDVGTQFSDIAITVEFTSEIFEQELPSFLQSSLVRIKLAAKHTHNLIQSRTFLERVIEGIINQLILFNKKYNRLHLFISAQATVAFSLGRRYLDGQIGNITVYNYDAIKKTYTWAISLINNKLKLEQLD